MKNALRMFAALTLAGIASGIADALIMRGFGYESQARWKLSGNPKVDALNVGVNEQMDAMRDDMKRTADEKRWNR